VVPGNHRAYLVTRGTRPHGVPDAPSRSNYELVCGQEQFCSEAGTRFSMGGVQQPLAPLVLGKQRLGWLQGTDHLPGFRRRYQCGCVVATEINPEVARTPEVTCVLIASKALDTEEHIRNLSGLDRKCRALTIEHHTERRQLCPGRDFVAIILHREHEAWRQWRTHGCLVRPKMQRWQEF
jgi:hypothetical protein